MLFDSPTDSENSGASEATVIEMAELLPPDKRTEFLQIIESHRGWLPPPKMLAQYNAVLPGLAERIVSMPEREQSHRHTFLDNEYERQFSLRQRGQILAMAGMVIIMAFAVFLAISGHAEWAAKVVIGTLVGIVGIFVTGRFLDFKTAAAEESNEQQPTD
ncbi:MAG: DUF2335 domain-containing protein [Novosphingobium sp.]